MKDASTHRELGASPAQILVPQAEEIAPGVWQLAHWLAPEIPVHVHLVRGTYAALVDTGVASTFPLLQRAFFESGLVEPRDVRVVLNTHGHHDHMGSNRQVRDATGALFAAPAGAVPWIEDHERHLREFLFHHPDLIPDTPDLRSEIGGTMDGPVRVDLAIDDRFVLNLGNGVSLEAVGLPGHVAAELGYLERGSGTLILGDAVTRADEGMPFFQGHNLPGAYRRTLHKLRSLTYQLPIRQVAPAHYRRMGVDAFRELIERMLEHIREVDSLVVEHVRAASRGGGAATLESVWRGVCAAAGKQPEFRSLAMVEAHLREAISKGLIVRSGPDEFTWIGA